MKRLKSRNEGVALRQIYLENGSIEIPGVQHDV